MVCTTTNRKYLMSLYSNKLNAYYGKKLEYRHITFHKRMSRDEATIKRKEVLLDL